MGSSSLNKVLPAFDMLLLLVVIFFGTAGLLQSMPQGGADANDYEDLQAAHDRLANELQAKKDEAEELERRLRSIGPTGDLPADRLETLLSAATNKQERIAEVDLILTDIRHEIDSVRQIVEDRHSLVVLQNAIDALRQRIDQLLREKEALEKNITEADRKKAAIQRLLERLRQLLDEIKRLEAEIDRIKLLIKEKEEQAPPAWRGGYDGPFILLECDSKGVTVYPGARRICLPVATQDTDWLKQEVQRVGAVALVARPSGFKESFAEFHGILTALAEKTTVGKRIFLSFWPIEAHESIEPYLPKE